MTNEKAEPVAEVYELAPFTIYDRHGIGHQGGGVLSVRLLKTLPAGTKLYADQCTVPTGWKLVPVEPTEDMGNAACTAIYQVFMRGLKVFVDTTKEAYEFNLKNCPEDVRIVYTAPQHPAQSAEQDERALTDEQFVEIQEAREILENMVRSVELDGNYSTEATCTFLRQALLCLPAAQPLSGGEA